MDYVIQFGKIAQKSTLLLLLKVVLHKVHWPYNYQDNIYQQITWKQQQTSRNKNKQNKNTIHLIVVGTTNLHLNKVNHGA